MKVLKKILLLLVVLTYPVYSQLDSVPTVKMTLTLKNAANKTKLLYFGIDSTATDSIDFHLGESDLPPWPPITAFEARFLLPESNFSGIKSSYSDYRNASQFPFTGNIEHRIQWQVGSGSTMNISWNLPNSVTGVLKDIATGTIVNVSMQDSGSHTITNAVFLTKLKVLLSYTDAIPVELTDFSADFVNNSVLLTWTTITETNNQGFEIQRCENINENNWNTIGFITGKGTTTERVEYLFLDNDLPKVEVLYYRLKQIDYDGNSKFSKITQVGLATPSYFSLEQNYPNPFNPSTNIKFSLPAKTSVKLTVYSLIGEFVEEITNGVFEAGNYNINWNAANLPSGVYFYKFQADKFYQTKKMTLIK